ncbi:putative ABC-type transporter permease protein [Desulforapulum autotrophicum HRM2]|jgi:putative spermidine/putrescine transport system permease protein|uniref:ABC-type transporter permease protein n=1 Tax=Desulforapulum autotrophicum (strain ATCC 43914 / DSM 3382 / VKM B-1955 / HRM2) TaxID=177437 RepID=C0QE39_DESAH|nr:ABC transporter permease subunit [Desulforapulum autotrophicum]ACN13156.1 putative ABC-type transporter permease protein [Desulforapulum autotrophicum HRM2]
MTRDKTKVMLIWTLFVLPLVVLALYSFAGRWAFPSLLPDTMDLRTLVYLKKNAISILTSMGSSFLYSMAAVFMSIVYSLLPASVLSRSNFPGQRLVESLLLAPAVLPVMTFSIGVHMIFIRLGLADTHLGVALILSIYSYPYMLRALMAGYATIDPDALACARNLGAGSRQILWEIEIPQLLPALVAGGSIVFLVAFSDYFLVFLIGGGSVPSYSGYLFPFLNSTDWSLASALTLLSLVPPLLLFLVLDLTLARLYRRWI